jgi:broad specificity phosphatase PhoE
MIRAAQSMRLHVARHAEAIKNIEKRHGGGDQRLTSRGERQARGIGHYLLDNMGVELGEVSVVHQPEGRSESTAKHVGEVVAARQITRCDDLVGIDLGVRNGLSEAELAEKFPEVTAGLADWTANKGFHVPDVPGGERMDDFANRIRRGMTESIASAARYGDLVMVATTSSLVMVHHLLDRDGTLSTDNYDFVSMPLGSVTTWQLSDNEQPMQLTNIVKPEER